MYQSGFGNEFATEAVPGALPVRGTVNAVPENCSAYRPRGTRCGEFPRAGRMPGTASVANSLPKPD